MNKKVLICATAVQLLFFMQGVAQSSKQVPAKHSADKKVDIPDPVASFRVIVDRFRSYFAAEPKLIVTQEPGKDGGFVVVVLSAEDLSFDVKKTDSLVTPQIGIISMKVSGISNADCGDLTGLVKGWSTLDGALAAARRSECFKPWPIPTEAPSEFDVKLKFGFQDGKWVFQRDGGTGMGIFDSLSYFYPNPKIDFTEPEASAMNAPWLALAPWRSHLP
jgi:hypothetical protein